MKLVLTRKNRQIVFQKGGGYLDLYSAEQDTRIVN